MHPDNHFGRSTSVVRLADRPGEPACCAIAVMAKASHPGRTKTRLSPPLTPVQAAELNPVLARRLYPRALPLGGPPTEADLHVLATLVHEEKRADDQVIGVGFGANAAEQAAAEADCVVIFES